MDFLCSQPVGVTFAESVFARGRGLGRLIAGLSEGDPVAWGITIVVVLIFIGIAVVKHYNGDN